ncbi:MAG: hypothetical protein JW720_09950 [Sedimentisphaerales bacterium]|nr:hypothetical protein [Sedimentisphaerales bacterium]
MNDDRIDEVMKCIGDEEVPADVRRIAEEVSNDFSKSLRESGQPEKHFVLELIMKSRTFKLAAAAAVVIAVLLGLPFLPRTASITLAEVLERVERTGAFMYRMKMAMTGSMMESVGKGEGMEMEMTATISNDYGMKVEMVTVDPNSGERISQQVYMSPQEKMAVTIMPEKKQYMRMKFDDALFERIKKQNNDPRELIKQFMGCKYKELGRSVIDGVEVQGFDTMDSAMLGGAGKDVKCTLWVDVDKWLPVRCDMEFTMGDSMHAKGTVGDFQWDIPVEESDFVPVIPDDYTTMAADGIKMPSMNEQGTIEGLRQFKDLLGRYPKDLNIMELSREIVSVTQSEEYRDRLKQLREQLEQSGEITDDQVRDAVMKDSMSYVQPLQSPGMFFMLLVLEKKEPVYYGETVGPEDTDKVLLRWKTGEDTYRVIFGDLAAADVSGEELDKIENPQE